METNFGFVVCLSGFSPVLCGDDRVPKLLWRSANACMRVNEHKCSFTLLLVRSRQTFLGLRTFQTRLRILARILFLPGGSPLLSLSHELLLELLCWVCSRGERTLGTLSYWISLVITSFLVFAQHSLAFSSAASLAFIIFLLPIPTPSITS